MKKALDTNLLVRYLMADDVIQSRKVEKLLENAVIQHKTFFIPAVVILETEWVLENVFELPKAQIIELLLELLDLNVLQIEYHDTFKHCLNFAKGKNFDLSDLIIGFIAQANACETTLTFDKNASKSPYFERLT